MGRYLPFFKRKGGIQFAGEGLQADGGGSYTLPIASASTLGGIKPGTGVIVNPETGVLSVTLQAATLPTASADNLGTIIQYTGATDANYTNGYYYKCVSDGGDPATYSWSQTNVQTSYGSDVSAIVNVYGAKNLLSYPYYETTKTINDITFTDNGDGTITASGIASSDANFYVESSDDFRVKKGTYILSGCPSGGSSTTYYMTMTGAITDDYGDGTEISYGSDSSAGCAICIKSGTDLTTPITFKLMLRDARISDNTYVPYAMTNKQLTDKVNIDNVEVIADGVKTYSAIFSEIFSSITIDPNAWYGFYIGGNCYSLVERSDVKLMFSRVYVSSSNLIFRTLELASTSTYHSNTNGVYENRSSEVPTSGLVIRLYKFF